MLPTPVIMATAAPPVRVEVVGVAAAALLAVVLPWSWPPEEEELPLLPRFACWLVQVAWKGVPVLFWQAAPKVVLAPETKLTAAH